MGDFNTEAKNAIAVLTEETLKDIFEGHIAGKQRFPHSPSIDRNVRQSGVAASTVLSDGERDFPREQFQTEMGALAKAIEKDAFTRIQKVAQENGVAEPADQRKAYADAVKESGVHEWARGEDVSGKLVAGFKEKADKMVDSVFPSQETGRSAQAQGEEGYKNAMGELDELLEATIPGAGRETPKPVDFEALDNEIAALMAKPSPAERAKQEFDQAFDEFDRAAAENDKHFDQKFQEALKKGQSAEVQKDAPMRPRRSGKETPERPTDKTLKENAQQKKFEGLARSRRSQREEMPQSLEGLDKKTQEKLDAIKENVKDPNLGRAAKPIDNGPRQR